MDTVVFAGIDKSIRRHTLSVRDFAAHITVKHAIENAGGVGMFPPEMPVPQVAVRDDLPIGIIGSGATGLYAAMILQDLGIEYEIIEAQHRDGGRLYTYRFNGEKGRDAPIGTPARYDYFDIGAMRYPRIPFMERVFDLFHRLDMRFSTDIHAKPEDKIIIPYHLTNDNTFSAFNGRGPATSAHSSTVPDYFHVSLSNGGTVPDSYALAGVDTWTGKAYTYYKKQFVKIDKLPPKQRQAAFEKAWDELTLQDPHSTRGYMLSGPNNKPPDSAANYPNSVVDWLETFDSATGLYDQAFVESVMDSLDFDCPDPVANPGRIKRKRVSKDGEEEEEEEGATWDWFCIDGGSDHIVTRMVGKLTKKPETGKRVTRIAHTERGIMAVDVVGEQQPRNYAQVICTVPLGCLSTIDTSSCDLLYSQRMAIRMLHYDASTKIALKFQKRWWEDPDIMSGSAIQGGQSSSDFPIRTCVYPSYGIGVKDAPGVLLASYTWAQDALRVGALAQGKGTPADLQLLDITLDAVSKLHNVSKEKMGPVVDHFAHSWYSDEYSRGAFALFGPGQFGTPDQRNPKEEGQEPQKQSLFASLKAPAANGKLHIANEATSIHHAWVLGSLNSAWRAVYNALQNKPDARQKLIDRWGIPDEETEVHLQLLSALAKYHKL